MSQHLHNMLANEIGQCKKRMFERLKAGAELEDAVAAFVGELRLAMECVVRKVKNVSLSDVPS